MNILDKTGLTYFWGKITSALSGKVDKETGKGLSSNDYTSTEKSKLAGIEAGADVNVQSDWNVTDTGADDYIKNKPTPMTQSEATQGTSTTPHTISAKIMHDIFTSVLGGMFYINAEGRLVCVYNTDETGTSFYVDGNGRLVYVYED